MESLMCIPQYCISNRHRAGFAVLSEKLGCLTPFNCSLPRLPLSTLKGCQKRPTTVSKETYYSSPSPAFHPEGVGDGEENKEEEGSRPYPPNPSLNHRF